MALEDEPEDIASFLARLRLPDRYVASFKENGYHTADDCIGLDEIQLKQMGVTLPGHFRRILNKLPKYTERKQTEVTAMDTLLPPPMEDADSGRSSPGLQYLPSQTESSIEARLEHRPLARNYSLPDRESEEDPYLNAGKFSARPKAAEAALSYRPLTPPPPEFSGEFQEEKENFSAKCDAEDIYESPTVLLPPVLESTPSQELVPPPFDSILPSPPASLLDSPPSMKSPSPPFAEEDPYLVSLGSATHHEKITYLASVNPADDYNILHEDLNCTVTVSNLDSKATSDGEGDYDHLKGDISINSSAPQSPGIIRNAVASIFPPSRTRTVSEEHEFDPSESDYDKLNSGMPQSPRRDIEPNISSLMTPPQSLSPSRKQSRESEDSRKISSPLTRTYSGETAKNMPLPPPPWKASLSAETQVTESSPGNFANSYPSVDNDESDYWAREAEGDDDIKKESSYDVLSLSRQGHTNFANKEMVEGKSSVPIDVDDEDGSAEYETVEFYDKPDSRLGSLCELPPVPHNTPSHIIDNQNEASAEEKPGSYEEVQFPFKGATHNMATVETAIYSGLEESALPGNASDQKNKKSTGVRRFTGMHAHLQKAAQTAKAAVQRKPRRRAKLAHTESFSDNENEESTASQRSPMNKSLEDLNNVPDLPPHHPKHHQRDSSDASSGGFVQPENPASLKASRLTRPSPISRRKRVDAQSSSSALDSTGSFGTSDIGIYEDLDLAIVEHAHMPAKTSNTLDQGTKTKQRPVKAPRQRPVSVFMDVLKSSQDDPGSDERSRTYSATLKRGIPTTTDIFDDEPQEYMDINEFLKSYQTQSPAVIPVSPLTKKRTKSGWLWKHGGHEGRAPLRKRWAVFDGDELAYYESESKTDFSKGILPVEVMLRLQTPQNSTTIFHLQMKGGRTFIFQAESSDERAKWSSTIMAAMLALQQKSAHQHKPGGNMSMPYKEGALKMEGVRQKVYVAIKGDQAAYYKSKNEFMFAQPISRLQMKLATVKDAGNRKFQVVFPYRTFTFTAESEDEKKSWIEPLQDAIAEGLSDYQVLREIWANESNKNCADCGRGHPDWASINLAIVICKHCAGVHRELGVHNSKVRSLKMDIKIWDATMKRLLIDIGNEEANRFWAAELNSSDGITDMADKNQRSWFIKSKYIDMDYVSDRAEGVDQRMLNQSLIDAVRTDDLIEAYHLTFSGADINCSTGKEYAKTPQLLAEHLTYTTLAEFLRQNGGTDVTSPDGHITDRNTSVRKKNSIPKTRARPPVCLKDFLFKYGGDFKNTSEDTKNKGRLNIIRSALQPGDFQKRLCLLENNTLKYCDPERPSIVKDSLSCSDLMSITVHAPEQAVKAGYQHCFELSRNSGRTYLFCTEKEDTRIRWTRGLMQEIVPAYIQDAMQTEEEYERIGKVKLKAKSWSKSDSPWSQTWCRLRKKKLQYYHNESRIMETIDLRKLVQIAVDQTRETTTNTSNGNNSKDSIPIIMLVFRDKSYFIHSDTKSDTESWMAAIRRSDNESGPTLEEKQLTTEGVPIVLEKCITYVEQFGIATRGIYRLSGTHSKTTQLLSDFHHNARETQMREGHMNVHDVANALKRWFKSLPGSLLTEQLHEQWVETAQIRQEHHNRKLEWYKHLIEKLPDINRVTLKVLLSHLINVSNHEKENEMSIHNLAIVFGPTLMEPQDEDGKSDKYLGQTSQEIACVEDLLRYYDWLFDVTDTDREKEQRMQLAKEKINQAKQQQNMLTTMDYDMMVPIYINKVEDRCVNYKVNLTAGELITKVCKAHGYPTEKWGLYEVILDGDAERPLHFSEHVLSVIKSWEMPSTNYLLAKNDYIRDKMRWFKQMISSEHETIMEGHLRFFEGKKKWSKVTGALGRNPSDGTIYFKYVKSASKPAVNINVSSVRVFIGVDKKSKPPGNGRQAFTLKQIGETPKFFIAETEGELYRWVTNFLLSMHPEGFTPPVTQESSPSKSREESGQSHRQSDARFSAYGTISQQELGAQIAARVINLQRTSSTESTGSLREKFIDHAQLSVASPQDSNPAPVILEDRIPEEIEATSDDVYDMLPVRHPSTGSLDYPSRPSQISVDSNHSRRTMLHHPLSPADPRTQQRAGLGIQLQDELSNVLRRKMAQ